MNTDALKKRVFLTITGIRTDADGNSMKTSTEHEAAWLGSTAGHSFLYTEEGLETVLFLSPHIVRLERGGKTGTRMVFDPSVTMTECSYATPFGTIPMEIRTERIVIMDGGRRERGSQKFRIAGRVKYTLRIGGDDPADCSVTIKAQQID